MPFTEPIRKGLLRGQFRRVALASPTVVRRSHHGARLGNRQLTASRLVLGLVLKAVNQWRFRAEARRSSDVAGQGTK